MHELHASALRKDARVAEGKRLLLEALSERQALLTGVQPPREDLKRSYAEALAAFADIRGGSTFFPYLASGFGGGPFVELADGSVKFDFITGIGVHYFGHGHPDLVEASLDAALDSTLMQGNLQQSEHSAELFRLLLAGANRKGAGFRYCFLTSSGAMANENALKMIFQKRSPASRVLAFEGCFMGRSLALSQITDKAAYREGLPLNLQVDYVPFFEAGDPEGSTSRALAALEKHLKRYPQSHAAMCFELVQGEGGYYAGRKDFFETLMRRLRQAGIAVFVDEIQTFGRMPELFAFQHFGLDEYVDVVSLGKMTQACATLIREEFKPGPGLVSQTFTASTGAIAAARVIVKSLMEEGYLGEKGKIRKLNLHMTRKLEDLAKRYPSLVEGPYGLGAMIAFTPLGGDADKVKRFLTLLFEKGVIAFSAGAAPARARFLMPVGAVEEKHIDEVMVLVEAALLETADMNKKSDAKNTSPS